MITASNDRQSYAIPVAVTPTTITEVIRGPRVPKELVKSTIFLLKRLGDAVRERAVPEFVAAYSGRILNTHPSLLPAFGGTMHAVAQALEHGVKVTGCTIHLVTDDLDNGPILLQECLEVRDDDDVASLHARIREREHRLLPRAVSAFAEGRVRVEGRRARVIKS